MLLERRDEVRLLEQLEVMRDGLKGAGVLQPLKARAALEGLSLSDYLLKEIQRAAERPTLAELRQRLARRTPVATRVPPAKAVRAERGRG